MFLYESYSVHTVFSQFGSTNKTIFLIVDPRKTRFSSVSPKYDILYAPYGMIHMTCIQQFILSLIHWKTLFYLLFIFESGLFHRAKITISKCHRLIQFKRKFLFFHSFFFIQSFWFEIIHLKWNIQMIRGVSSLC